MTSAQVETDYTDAYENSSDWCHDCGNKPPIDVASTASPSGVRILRAGTTWDCPTCESRWIVARIEEVGLRWMTTGGRRVGTAVAPGRTAYHGRMGSERTVWAVCNDEWESNGPIVAFTSEALANEHCAALNAESGNHDVRAIPLLDEAPRRVTWHHRQASLRRNGTVEPYEQKPRTGWHYDHEADPTLLICEPRYGVTVNAYATDAEVARATCEAATEAELAARQWSHTEGWGPHKNGGPAETRRT